MFFQEIFFFKIYLLFIYFYFIFGCVGSLLQHAGSLLKHAVSFVLLPGLLSSCGVQILSSLVVARRLQGVWALQLWRASSVVCCTQAQDEARELSICGARA